jgi:hypothetical protein
MHQSLPPDFDLYPWSRSGFLWVPTFPSQQPGSQARVTSLLSLRVAICSALVAHRQSTIDHTSLFRARRT